MDMLNLFGVLCMVCGLVLAPPPLEVELDAEREYLQSQREQQSNLNSQFFDSDVLENIKEDNSKTDIDFIDEELPELMTKNYAIDKIEETNSIWDKDFDSNGNSENESVALPTQWEKYDLDKDGFVNETELESVIGFLKNTDNFFKAMDRDYDGLLSKEEFKDILSNLNEPEEESFEDKVEFIDYDADQFQEILENDSNDSR